MKTLHKIHQFIKQETILTIGAILALLSTFFVHPDHKYKDYIDWNTLLLLFCLMAVMAGFKQLGVFRAVGIKLLSYTRHTRQLACVLVFLPFILSMFITNDVALITFVPFCIIVLRLANTEHLLIPIVTLQTIAANLGSMLMPMGNPQNLYLYTKSNMTLSDFCILMLPYTAASALCLLLSILLIKKEPIRSFDRPEPEKESHIPLPSVFLYSAAFFLCLLCVADLLNVWILTFIIIFFLLIYDRHIFACIDYALLGTFIIFFIFIGNIGRLPEFRIFLEHIINGHETIVAVLSSQIISNVPTALLLSGFSDNWEALIIGTNLGGLGTLIASMASLISYKQITLEYPDKKGSYLLFFTLANIIGLLLLLGLNLLFV